MKLRQDFVTNSSSSSYIVVANITYCDELLDYMKEEHGKHGVRLLGEYLMGAKALKDYLDECIGLDCIASSVLDRIDETDTTAKYLAASFISWTNDGDTEGDDAWLYEHIPDKFKEDIYQSSSD